MILRDQLGKRVLVLDGAMGTSIQTYKLTSADFGGKEGYNDYLCLTRPDVIEQIHAGYLEAGADLIETNTFGGNRKKTEEYGLTAEEGRQLNLEATRLARRVADRFSTPGQPRYVAGSMGPTGFLPSSNDPVLGQITCDELREIYAEQSSALIEGGVDALLIETSQDILEVRSAVLGARDAIQEAGRDVLLICQVTLDPTGKMLLGTDIGAALTSVEGLGIDVFGLNCSTGPEEMREPVRFLAEHCRLPISVVPNAGMPENVEGQACYRLSEAELAKQLQDFAAEFGVAIVGGCCGTHKGHIKAVAEAVKGVAPKARQVQAGPALSSAMRRLDFDIDNKPLIIGERVNTQGSRKIKRLLLADDYDGVLEVAREQVDGGAHLLDICVALTERDDEDAQMVQIIKLLSQSVEAPLVIDTTDPHVVEAALKVLPGRGIVNSIHLEGDGTKFHKVAPLIKEYDQAAVCMCIGPDGMAKTRQEKLAVARLIHDTLVQQYGISPSQMVFDVLTFTLATGDDEFKPSAVETIEGIRLVKQNLPGVYTTLGLSNVSFGLSPAARKVVNSVFLYHCVQAGLDLAIANPKELIPYPSLKDEDKQIAEDLIFNRHPDALPRLIQHFDQVSDDTDAPETNPTEGMTTEERIHWQILNRKKEGIEKLLDDAMTRRSPPAVINDVLLPAMKEVGDRMATGELILPFVLQSAEVMKKAVAYLENFLDKDQSVSKGTLVLATVYGDVHDIGKNLVRTILENNGYTVHDLGKQVPLNTILAKADEVKADAIGLSALLVTTSKQMAYCVEECHHRHLPYPIVIGGAAINRDFSRRIAHMADGTVRPVFYAKDAFEGLHILNQLMDPETRQATIDAVLRDAHNLRRSRPAATPAAAGLPSAVSRMEPVPEPPFWGRKALLELDIADVWQELDLHTLFTLHWGVRGKSQVEREALIEKEFKPLLANMQAEIIRDRLLVPQAVYGYFPCQAQGDDLIVFSPDDPTREKLRFSFPRQAGDEHLCLTDYFRSDKLDVLPVMVVTVGPGMAELCERLSREGDYSRSYFLHGLAVESAEALTAFVHRRIREELNIDGRGQRYSFGYPACPELSDQRKLFALLGAEQVLPVKLTDAFQIDPEASTSALVIHHKEAKYYQVRA